MNNEYIVTVECGCGKTDNKMDDQMLEREFSNGMVRNWTCAICKEPVIIVKKVKVSQEKRYKVESKEIKFKGNVVSVEGEFMDVYYGDAEGKLHCLCDILKPLLGKFIEITIKYKEET